jgi:hypothetical protein
VDKYAMALLAGGPALTIFACTIPTEGAPSLRFLAKVGGDAACYLILLWIRDQTPWRRHFRLPPFAKNAMERGTHGVGNAGKIKSLGHPPSSLSI